MKRIALDIDSTLHHYWDLFARVVSERCGIELSYTLQQSWQIAALDHGQLSECVAETHSDANILAAAPYPGAVEAVCGWRKTGHWIQVTSHRAAHTRSATTRWLEQIGLCYDELYLSFDKVSRCLELGIDLLVDDSPVNLERARQAGMLAATIVHPWNAHLVGCDGVIGARSWPDLVRRLQPVLG